MIINFSPKGSGHYFDYENNEEDVLLVITENRPIKMKVLVKFNSPPETLILKRNISISLHPSANSVNLELLMLNQLGLSSKLNLLLILIISLNKSSKIIS